jgi:prepilin peptidase CpaA
LIDMKFPSPDFVFLLCASLCASIGAVSDMRTRRIPNFLTASFLVFGLLLHLGMGGWKAMGLAAAAGLVGGAVFFLFFIVGGMGAGDVKLMAAVSSIAGFGHLAEIFVATAVTGGLFAVALAISRGRLKSTLANVGTLIGHHGAMGLMPHPELNVDRPGTLRLPYGLAIAAGCWIAFLAPTVLG